MPSTSFAFDPDDFSGEFTLEDDADPSEWPEMEVEIDYKLHSPEPDVGIFHAQPEVTSVRYLVDGIVFATEAEFVAVIYEAIGDEIEEGQDFVADKIAAQIAVWERELDGDDD